jgi:2-dehydro-3-deoxyphosphogluconate aldolase/(4S)-4-hydroxy-2-oxoglutarate aldolase
LKDIFERIREIGIVPVIAISDVEKAVPLARALLAGGIPCAEVTFRTAEGEECIRRITATVPEVLVGAGTVLSPEQADRAQKAGARFVVSPGFNPRVVKHCVENGILIIPGCSNPSDMEAAMEFGLDTVKFFPAKQAGGLAYIKACAAPYTGLRFMPTGGINAENIGEYIVFDRIIACGGSWMVTKELLDAGDFAEITRLSKEAVEIVRDVRRGLNTR